MFLNAVILILQEILEASLLISILLVLHITLRKAWPNTFVLSRRWVLAALGWGAAGALFYGWMMPVTSVWFDYAGYEVVSALLQASIITCLALLCYLLNYASLTPGANYRMMKLSMIALVAFSIVREGSEIILYVQGVMQQPENLTPVLLGAVMAAGIGCSSGLLLYAALSSGLAAGHGLRVATLLLALFGGNMAAQAIALLTQADWLPYTAEAWNSAALLPEYSISGQLLYALVGYEANPSVLQVLAYLAVVALVVCSPLFRSAWFVRTASNSV